MVQIGELKAVYPATRPKEVTYLAALGQAERELKALVATYDATGKRIAVVADAIKNLREVLGLRNERTEDLSKWGLTDACRFILAESEIPMTPIDVRDRLALKGFPIDNHTNPLASIHSVLKRLAQSDFATTIKQDQKIYYMKKPDLPEVKD